MKLFVVAIACLMVPALAAPTPDSLVARGGSEQIHCEPPLLLDEHANKCVPPHCESKDEYFDVHAGKCVPNKKPEHPPKPQDCPKGMRYNPKTMKCYSPARHPSEDNCKWLGKAYDAHKNVCVDSHPEPAPKPHECPDHMRYNPKTMKCYNPARHPSEDNCKWLGKVYNKHENKCEDAKPAPVPKPHCENKWEYYDEHAKKCLPIKKPEQPAPKPKPQEPVKPHCENKWEYYDEHAKKCLPIKKPEPAPKPHCENKAEYYDEHAKKCLPIKKPEPAPKPHCENKAEYYDEWQKKCLPIHKPAPKPQPAPKPHCENPHEYYNEHEKKCVPIWAPEPKPQDCPQGMRYNPSTKKCYSPARHPSEDNCKYLGKAYDAHKNVCVDYKPAPKPEPAPKPHCESKDEYYDEWQKKCLPIKKPEPKPEPAPKPHCESKDEYYDEHAKKCLPIHKPEPAPKPQDCPDHMRYNDSTKKCYNPARHPSEDNCAWLGQKYNAHENKCEDKH